MSCASTFLGAQCQKHAGHNGVHFARDPSGYMTVWTDASADIEDRAMNPVELRAQRNERYAH